jgi:hypothetical protein
MKWIAGRLAWAVIGVLAWALPAPAATMQAVYTGTIDTGFDTAGLFGSAGTDLGGVAFRLSFTYDTGSGFLDTSTPGVQRLWGGALYGLAPLVTARFTVNGQTQTINGGYQGYVSQCSSAACPAAPSGLVQHLATDFTTDPVTGVSHVVYASTFEGLFGGTLSGSVPSDLTQPYTLTFDGTIVSFFNYFFFDVYDPVTGYSNNAYAYLNPTRLTVAPIAAVPVPASGAGMLAAALGVLAALRMRQRRTGAA